MWHSAWKTFHVHGAQKRACSPHQEPHAQTVGAKASSSVQSLPSLAIPCGQSQPSSLEGEQREQSQFVLAVSSHRSEGTGGGAQHG